MRSFFPTKTRGVELPKIRTVRAVFVWTRVNGRGAWRLSPSEAPVHDFRPATLGRAATNVRLFDATGFV